MKTKRDKTNEYAGDAIICKTVSLPSTLFKCAEKIVKSDPELDFSKYVRKLIRADLEATK